MRILKWFVLFIVLFSSPAGLSIGADDTSKDVTDFKLDVKEFSLENGMLFLVVERHTTPQVACRIAIRAGSALETAGKTGIAHLLEHMMFKGTKNFGTRDIEKDEALQKQIEDAYQVVLSEEAKRQPDAALIKRKRKEMEQLRLEVQNIYVPQALSVQLGKNGAVNINAFTSKDETQYYTSVPSDMIEQWFSIISEQLFEPSWREFYVEKEVVQREWAYRYSNNPNGAAWLDLNSTAFTAHPYRNPTIGWKSDMEKFNTADAMVFHQTYYHPTNAVCVLVGDVTVKQVKKLAETYFKRYPRGKCAPEIVTREPRQEGSRESIRYFKGTRTPLLRIGFHVPRMGNEDFYALDVMTMILSYGRSARMTQHIVNKGLATRAWAYNPNTRYGGLLVLGGTPNELEGLRTGTLSEEEKRRFYLEACRELEGMLLKEINVMKTEAVSSEELLRIKKLNQREIIDSMRSNEGLARSIATMEVQIGWRYLITYLEKMMAVTPEDIKRVAGKYIRPENKTSVYVIPGGKLDKRPAAYTEIRSAGLMDFTSDLTVDLLHNKSIYPTPDGWKHPLSFRRTPIRINYQKAEAEWIGKTKVFYLSDRELPLIDLVILVKAGAIDLPSSQVGLEKILNQTLIRGGSQARSPGELARFLDENAVQISISVGQEQSTINLSVLKDDWQKGLEILKEILMRPLFDSEVLSAVKKQNLATLKRQGGDAQAVVGREALIRYFKGHPYGRDPLIGIETIPTITGDELRHFMRTYIVPSNMVAAVSGDIGKEQAMADLKEFFQSFPSTDAPVRILEEPKPSGPVLSFIHKAGQVQSQIVFLLPGVKRTHPAYWKINLMANIFGGDNSILSRRLREDLGYVYSSWFGQTYKWKVGFLIGYMGCKGDKTAEAIEETVGLMKAIKNRMPKNEIELKRLDVLNSFVFNVDSPSALVEAYARYHLRGESLSTLEAIQEAYLTVTRDELKSLTQMYLEPKELRIFLVGDRGTIVEKKNGKEATLETELKDLAKRLGLPYEEIELR